eukprot:superscaffoldBa00001344_g10163
MFQEPSWLCRQWEEREEEKEGKELRELEPWLQSSMTQSGSIHAPGENTQNIQSRPYQQTQTPGVGRGRLPYLEINTTLTAPIAMEIPSRGNTNDMPTMEEQPAKLQVAVCRSTRPDCRGLRLLYTQITQCLALLAERKCGKGVCLEDLERGGASGVPSQISAKLPVMKERMTATPSVAFEVRSDREIKGIPPKGSPKRVKIHAQPPRGQH